jgi:hypothetical protein
MGVFTFIEAYVATHDPMVSAILAVGVLVLDFLIKARNEKVIQPSSDSHTTDDSMVIGHDSNEESIVLYPNGKIAKGVPYFNEQ